MKESSSRLIHARVKMGSLRPFGFIWGSCCVFVDCIATVSVIGLFGGTGNLLMKERNSRKTGRFTCTRLMILQCIFLYYDDGMFRKGVERKKRLMRSLYILIRCPARGSEKRRATMAPLQNLIKDIKYETKYLH